MFFHTFFFFFGSVSFSRSLGSVGISSKGYVEGSAKKPGAGRGEGEESIFTSCISK